MKILYVAQNYLPEMGANPGRISEMAREWVLAGHTVEVLAPVPNHPTGIVPPEFRGFRVFRDRDEYGVDATRTWIYATANRGRLRRSLSFASFGLASVIAGARTSRPDIVIGSSPQLLAAVGGCSIAKLHRVPWVFEVRDLWPESVVAVGAMRQSHPVVRGLFHVADALYESARRVVVVTETFKTILAERGIPEGKIRVIPNGVDLTRFSPKQAEQRDRELLGGSARFIVSYMGTHGMAHDLTRLLEVAERMKHRSDVAFAFVGDGAERESLERFARQRHLCNVRFLGVQPRDRMPAFYAATDLCVVPLRRSEVFLSVLPSKIFEIMGMAKPLVLAVDGEARRVVEAAGAGVFVPPGDTDALVGAIERLLAAPDELALRGVQGRSYVEREFDRKRLAGRYLDVLLEAAVG